MDDKTAIYAFVGFLVVSNLGVMITLLTILFRAGMFVAYTKMGIKDAKDSSVRAHKRIDKLEESD